jgi:hypothetical protein
MPEPNSETVSKALLRATVAGLFACTLVAPASLAQETGGVPPHKSEAQSMPPIPAEVERSSSTNKNSGPCVPPAAGKRGPAPSQRLASPRG